MKLIIQIPCYNEEKTLPITINDLPKEIEGIDEIEYLIINDGSTDNTVEVAKQVGVHHIVSFPQNRGLAKGFMAGLDACLKLGADIIVNTDADNQYCGHDIEKLVQPIINKSAEIVIGERPIDNIDDFSLVKKKLQRLGSWTVRMASNTNVPDAPSGFRAFSREAAMRMNVVSEYTYTLETIIQAGHTNMCVTSVSIDTNEKTRESRLFKSMFAYIRKSVLTIIRIFVMYKPFRFFAVLGLTLLLISTLLGGRFAYFYFVGHGNDYVKSLIVAGVMLLLSAQVFIVGLLADIIAANRKLLEELLFKVRKLEYDILFDRNTSLDKEPESNISNKNVNKGA